MPSRTAKRQGKKSSAEAKPRQDPAKPSKAAIVEAVSAAIALDSGKVRTPSQGAKGPVTVERLQEKLADAKGAPSGVSAPYKPELKAKLERALRDAWKYVATQRGTGKAQVKLIRAFEVETPEMARQGQAPSALGFGLWCRGPGNAPARLVVLDRTGKRLQVVE